MKVLLVTEHTADDRKSLAAVRSLARNGAHVAVASDTSICPPLWSRHCKSRIRCPDPVSDWENFSDWISKQVLQGQYDLVLPLSDYPTMALVEQQSTLTGRMAIPIPPAEFCALAHDKLKLIRLASTLGIDVPQTWCPANREDVKAFSRSVSTELPWGHNKAARYSRCRPCLIVDRKTCPQSPWERQLVFHCMQELPPGPMSVPGWSACADRSRDQQYPPNACRLRAMVWYVMS